MLLHGVEKELRFLHLLGDHRGPPEMLPYLIQVKLLEEAEKWPGPQACV